MVLNTLPEKKQYLNKNKIECNTYIALQSYTMLENLIIKIWEIFLKQIDIC